MDDDRLDEVNSGACGEGCRIVCERHRAEYLAANRLRDLLARLEWNRDGRCNGCNGFQYESGSFPPGHEDDCWVAAALGHR